MTVDEIKEQKQKINIEFKEKYMLEKLRIKEEMKKEQTERIQKLKDELKEEKKKIIRELNLQIKRNIYKEFYDKYLKVERKTPTIRDSIAMELFGLPFKNLSKEQQTKVFSKYVVERRKKILKNKEGE